MIKGMVCLVAAMCTLSIRSEVQISSKIAYSGVCDASAGAALDGDFFAAADDETNRLRIYSLSSGGAPVFELSTSAFLRVDFREPEADIEGAARVGDVIYWITSHARNQKGKERSSRQRFFATKIVPGNPPKLELIGTAYTDLLEDFGRAPQLKPFSLEDAAELAPKDKHALNIEGLCAGPNGSLLIGFRNPVIKKKALLVPLLNSSDVVLKPGTRAHLGDPIRLDLNGRGIRDMVQQDGRYFIIAGAYDSGSRFELYAWDGRESTTLLYRWEKNSPNPEAILAPPGKPELLVLTDEGSRSTRGLECKDLSPSARRFHGMLLHPDPR